MIGYFLTDDIKTALYSFRNASTNVTYAQAQLAFDEKPDYLRWKLHFKKLIKSGIAIKYTENEHIDSCRRVPVYNFHR